MKLIELENEFREKASLKRFHQHNKSIIRYRILFWGIIIFSFIGFFYFLSTLISVLNSSFVPKDNEVEWLLVICIGIVEIGLILIQLQAINNREKIQVYKISIVENWMKINISSNLESEFLEHIDKETKNKPRSHTTFLVILGALGISVWQTLNRKLFETNFDLGIIVTILFLMIAVTLIGLLVNQVINFIYENWIHTRYKRLEELSFFVREYRFKKYNQADY